MILAELKIGYILFFPLKKEVGNTMEGLGSIMNGQFGGDLLVKRPEKKKIKKTKLKLIETTSVCESYELLVLVLVLSLEEERVIAEEEKCLLSGRELLVSFRIKWRFSKRRVRRTFSTTNPSISITCEENDR